MDNNNGLQRGFFETKYKTVNNCCITSIKIHSLKIELYAFKSILIVRNICNPKTTKNY